MRTLHFCLPLGLLCTPTWTHGASVKMLAFKEKHTRTKKGGCREEARGETNYFGREADRVGFVKRFAPPPPQSSLRGASGPYSRQGHGDTKALSESMSTFWASADSLTAGKPCKSPSLSCRGSERFDGS